MYAAHHEELRVFNERNGFQCIEYKRLPATLVESGRDAAIAHALQYNYDAVLQIDADMSPFQPNAMAHLLEQLFVNVPAADAIGAYCNLKAPPFLPTIDTGTGTWENHYPGGGVTEVIRTGGAFLMAKTSAFRKFGPPWFRTKISNKPLDALVNVDNFARCKLSGKNPFYDSADWLSLMMTAREAGPGESGIGEDSGFCDRLRAAGGHIFVDTDIVVGHVGKEVIDWRKHKEAMDKREEVARQAVGVRG
jgi:hypothetical protein